MKNKIIRLVISFLAFLAALFVFLNTHNTNAYGNYFLVPLVYGICLLLSRNITFTDIKSPGILVLNCTMVVKYIFMPTIMCLGGYYSWLGKSPLSSSVNSAVALTLVELIAITIISNVLQNRYKNNRASKQIETQPISRYSIYSIIIALGIITAIFVPETISDQRFILDTGNLDTTVEVDFLFSGFLKILIVFARYTLVLLAINYFYKSNKRKKSIFNVLCAFIPVIINCLFISNLSRINIFVPVLTFSSIILILFNSKKEKRVIIRSLLLIMSIGIVLISAFKFFGEGRGNEGRSNDIGWWGDTINMYFSGPKETAIGFEAERIVDDEYGWRRHELLLNDSVSNVIGLSNFSDEKKTSTALFNLRYFSSRIAVCQIVPNIIEGYYYFGFFLCWIWPCIFVFLCYYFDNKVKNANTVDRKFSFLYASIYAGMVLMINSAMIISNIINISVLFLVIAAVNNKIRLNRVGGAES